MSVPLPQNKRFYTNFFTTLLLSYLLVFSCFALYHAYAENEIFDAHECAIGLWIQQGQATLTFFAGLALFLSIVSRKPIFHTPLLASAHFFQCIPRGPPLKLIASWFILITEQTCSGHAVSPWPCIDRFILFIFHGLYRKEIRCT